MEKLDFNLDRYKQNKKKSPPHKLADEAQRLCDKIGIPFNTFILRAVKINSMKAWSLAGYMKEKGISNINYFTKSFYAKQ